MNPRDDFKTDSKPVWHGAREREANKKTILEFVNVYKYYGPEVPALRGVTFSIDRGEFVYITGASGAGKSTLLRLVYRADSPDQGRVYFCGRDISRLRHDSVPFLRRNLGIVFQDFKVLAHRTAYENVAFALEVLGTAPRALRRRVFEALEQVGLDRRANEQVGCLSGGEQQRVAVARAIVSQPDLLLADEPTGNLDPELSRSILRLFEKIHAAGTTVVVATHDRSLLDDHPHRVVSLAEGRATDMEALDFAWTTTAARPAEVPSKTHADAVGREPTRPAVESTPAAVEAAPVVTQPRLAPRVASISDAAPETEPERYAVAAEPDAAEPQESDETDEFDEARARPSALLEPEVVLVGGGDDPLPAFANLGLGDGSTWDESPEEILRSILVD